MFPFYDIFKNKYIFLNAVFREFNKNLKKYIINILNIIFFLKKLISLICRRLYKYNYLIENYLSFLLNVIN